jgi:hypothetical protein
MFFGLFLFIMIQLYFLSILCNGLSGYILFSGGGEENETIENSAGILRFSIHNPTFQFALGILSAITGVLKLLSPIENRIPILGDFVPALAGIAGGFILIFSHYRRNVSSSSLVEESKLDRAGESLLRYRKTLGIGLLGVALLHFLFPQAFFL